ncbi:TetR/AcrR family transcriptional regulator [Microbispora bryophytorum]|uniref:TetR family transcriptional regulator n=1 Tax=Microbispora bryophytorum TaxID=1460882 RepID=A0A8H9LG76_9ACTN|nr:TetR/AcrR family transcriptional regulator [Microbispora bryophytorum]MBD3138308.1 TetR/AcrR family transcriptional regulator [Microbispora bryophytorum]TQS04049.1 TetR/AcrR family transcriptional regulator [Microbispora bryophytorum]GGO25897.1 TetR family transcriptional regulator [Microbispora bryophytorum]
MTERKKPVGQPDKRRAITAGALTLFARDGYTRAGLDAIAAEAGVSNRTIYNHFTDKAELFQAVMQESTQRVADTMVDIIDRHLTKIIDLESDLIDFGLAWLGVLTSDLAPHFALIRQINAEIEHIPPAALQLWQQTGPGRTRCELAERLRRIAERGVLTIDDPARAAGHLMLLISADNLTDRADLHNENALREMVAAGVSTFLYGYAKRTVVGGRDAADGA